MRLYEKLRSGRTAQARPAPRAALVALALVLSFPGRPAGDLGAEVRAGTPGVAGRGTHVAPLTTGRSVEADPWIHIRVVESGEEAARVEVHLPLSLMTLGLDMVPDSVLVEGRLRLRNSDVSVSDLRRIWNELRAAGDADFVTVEKPGETVRVSRSGDRLLVSVEKKAVAREQDLAAGGPAAGDRENADAEGVRIEVPVAIVDALLAGQGNQLDVGGALAQLGAFRGEVLRVRDGGSDVRIWIDERSAGSR